VSGAVPRGDDLRLARLHLRGGAYALARVELETLAGADGLDRAGILDLAEVRWRTGDLGGADAAAAAWLEDGDEPGIDGALAHAISAEAAADRGSPAEAATHVEMAAGGLGDRGAWMALLAGILPRAAWPWSAEEPEPSAEAASREVASVSAAPGPGPAAEGAPGSVVGADQAPAATPAPDAVPGPLSAGVPISRSAAELVRAGAPLVAVAPDRAAILLALALRADRAAAEAVLAALDAAATPPVPAGDAGDTPAPQASATLVFVRAEALRAAGRHEESRIAYASAERLALEPGEAGTPGSPQ